jgi:hypothetical protein
MCVMVGTFTNFVVLVCAVLLLAACGGGGGGASGGGGGGGPAPDPRLARLAAYEAQKLRVLGDTSAGISALPLTSDATMPADGTVSFAGSATIRVELQADPLVLYGDATLDMDFGTGQISGTLQNFFGATPQVRVANYEGEITVTGDTPAQNMTLGYSGSLTASGQALGLDGALDVLFLGEPIAAIAASDLEAVVDHNGTLQDATVIVIGEGTVTPPPDPPVVPP